MATLQLAQIIERAVSENDNLKEILQFCKGSVENVRPSNLDEWKKCLLLIHKDTHQSHSPDEWADAIYDTWGPYPDDGSGTSVYNPDASQWLTSAQLGQGLSSLFPNHAAEVPPLVNKYFVDIVISVDVTGILAMHLNDKPGGPTYLSKHVTATDNHRATSSGEGGSELDTMGIQPKQTITWSAVPSQVQLTKFTYQNETTAVLAEFIHLPVQHIGTNFITAVETKPPHNANDQYAFEFKINNGAHTYYWDPFIGNTKVPS